MSGYRLYVWPVLHLLATAPQKAAWCQPAGNKKPDTIWIDALKTWARADGTWVSGWDEGSYFAFRPNWLSRMRLRWAIRRFAWQAKDPRP